MAQNKEPVRIPESIRTEHGTTTLAIPLNPQSPITTLNMQKVSPGCMPGGFGPGDQTLAITALSLAECMTHSEIERSTVIEFSSLQKKKKPEKQESGQSYATAGIEQCQDGLVVGPGRT